VEEKKGRVVGPTRTHAHTWKHQITYLEWWMFASGERSIFSKAGIEFEKDRKRRTTMERHHGHNKSFHCFCAHARTHAVHVNRSHHSFGMLDICGASWTIDLSRALGRNRGRKEETEENNDDDMALGMLTNEPVPSLATFVASYEYICSIIWIHL